MAVLGKVTCVVESNKEALKEYDDPEHHNSDLQRVAKYIEARSGVEFYVRVSFTNSLTPKWSSIIIEIYVDAKYITGGVIDKSKYGRGLEKKYWVAEGAGRMSPDGTYWIAPFKFQDIEASQTDNSGLDLNDVAQLGNIEIKVSHYDIISLSPSLRTTERQSAPNHTVPEKLLKGKVLSHSVSYGEERPANIRERCDGKTDDFPIAHFVFKYRSRQSLQSLMLIPRSPTPPPSTETLEARVRDLEAALKRNIKEENVKVIKRERDEEVDEIMATARVNKRRKATGTCQGIDVIDLDVEEHEDAIVIE